MATDFSLCSWGIIRMDVQRNVLILPSQTQRLLRPWKSDLRHPPASSPPAGMLGLENSCGDMNVVRWMPMIWDG